MIVLSHDEAERDRLREPEMVSEDAISERTRK